MDAGDIFSMFEDIFGDTLGGVFGGGRRRGRQRGGARRGYDLETQIELSLEQVYTGTEHEVDFTRQDVCDACTGTGHKPGSEPIACVTCGGAGQVAQAGLGGMFRMVTTCPACHGAGKVYKDICAKCKGAGRQPRRRKLSIKIPAGIQDGQAVRVAGEGEPGVGGGPRGDLHVIIRIAEHKLFIREDDHLILRMPTSFTQASLGAELDVPTLNGQQKLTIPAGTQHGDLLRLPGFGLPNLRGGQKGELVIVVQIEIPKRLSDNQKDILRQFADTEDHKMMPESHGFWSKIKEYLSA
jgi:molecular chaperone DnaJ